MSAESLSIYLYALPTLLGIGLAGWLYSLYKGNVNVVDSLWSLMFLIAALLYLLLQQSIDGRAVWVVILVAIWATRLSVHLTLRNWGETEDHRYATIRANNQPGFRYKSLYLVFGLQALLAWIISTPLLIAVQSAGSHLISDVIGSLLCGSGILFQSVADYQLYKFRKDTSNKGKVLTTGLWQYTRHPNYFGECCIWWGFYLLSLPEGGLWAIHAPLLMTFLLLKVSGVRMMEADMQNRRPDYRQYVRETNAFIPGRKKRSIETQQTRQACHD